MNNPLILFYAKVYQYFTYAGIKTVNIHIQASFIFAVTMFYYLRQMVAMTGWELSTPFKMAVLLFEPIVHIAAYLYFNKAKMKEKLEQFNQSENGYTKFFSSMLTLALITPMLIYFTKILIG